MWQRNVRKDRNKTERERERESNRVRNNARQAIMQDAFGCI